MHITSKAIFHPLSLLLFISTLVVGTLLTPPVLAESEGHYYRGDFTSLNYQTESFTKVQDAYNANKAAKLLNDDSYYLTPSIQFATEVEYFPINTDYSYENFWTRLEFIIRTPDKAAFTGSILWNVGNNQTKKLDFKLQPADADPKFRDLFWQKRAEYYRNLLNRNRSNAGAAWFRYQYRQSLARLSASPESETIRQRFRDQQRFQNEMNDELTFALATGGRAISENLQLPAPLFVREDQEPTIGIGSLEGITIREYDWTELTKDLTPAKDLLANAIPHDQHGVFFRSFQGVLDLVDQAKSQSSYLVMLANAGAQDAETRQFYERQLCLSLDSATRVLGSQLVKSVALTGGDLYLRTGTDIALVLEPSAVGEKTLLPLLAAQITAKASQNPNAKSVTGNLGNINYSGYLSEDRRISTYWALIGGNVVVTNSISQLERLDSVSKAEIKPLSKLAEYTFFRNRYSLLNEAETAFIFISDATIRRWCGPRWRIATARRTRAVAKMAEVQAANMDALVNDQIQPGPAEATLDQIDAGELTLNSNGVHSDIYGTLEFQTPISEMVITKVSKAEAEGYNRWRAGYQSRWRNFFAPIGIQLSMSDGFFESDVTVMPLIAGSDYRDLIDLSQGSSLDEASGDPHAEAIMHFVLSLNDESELLRELNSVAGNIAPGLQIDITSWIGDSVAVYADKSPFWDEVIEVAESAENRRGFDSNEVEQFFQANLNRLPVAARIEVASAFRLGLFLTAGKGFTQSAAPGLLVWETLTHKEQPYVSIASPMLSTDDDFPDDLRIYYLATGKQLLFTLNKDMIIRAIDREQARAAGKETPADKANWFGSNMGVKISEQMTRLYMPLIEDAASRDLQRLSWENLPILNEWKKRYPDQDPGEIHHKFWQRRLLCPGGGEYLWNPDTRQIESSVYGSPVNPIMPAIIPVPHLLRDLKSGEFGVSFEDDGVRARALLKLK